MSKKIVTLNAKSRKKGTKGDVNALRRDGYIPAIMYGGDQDPSLMSVKRIDYRTVADHHGLIKLICEDSEHDVIIRDSQPNYLEGRMLHLDFQEIKKGQKITVSIPLHSVGEPAGLKEGGQLSQILYDVEIFCTPADMPESIEVDVSELHLNQSISISDLPQIKGVEYLQDENSPIFAVDISKIELDIEEEEDGEELLLEGEESIEPEVIGEKKEGEEK
ncbi:MAG: 50S ribosomal protein L25 [Verrucomicrobiota bacterium]|nr:50S ribosomal protein L25 [Verrucomicrobiota bacterium]